MQMEVLLWKSIGTFGPFYGIFVKTNGMLAEICFHK